MEEFIEIFKRMCQIRHFELQVVKGLKDGYITCPVYLSIGQEAISATISTMTKGFSIFAQHRSHSVYISYGGNLERLIDELLGLETGCCGSAGGSPCIQDKDISMFGHHGLIGENIPLATGFALATNKPTIVYFGDAAAEEDYALSSYGFAVTHKLPILYICEDNDLSILTPIKDRRSWNVYDVCKSMGMRAETLEDDPYIINKQTEYVLNCLPAFLNIKTCRHYWHVGAGMDALPKEDRLDSLRKIIPNADKIESEIKDQMEKIWEKQLQKL